MPASVRIIRAAEDARDSETPPPLAEDIKLWMPSQLSPTDRLNGCTKGLGAMESKLREAQCSDALTSLHSRLHAKRHLINFRNGNIVGQKNMSASK